MTNVELEELSSNCFFFMLSQDRFVNDSFLSTLSSILFVLGNSGAITDTQKVIFIQKFFRKYNDGLKDPMPDDHINEVLVPHIIDTKEHDISDAFSVLDHIL